MSAEAWTPWRFQRRPEPVGTVIVEVTCELCGQSWHRNEATAEQFLECVFCGHLGRLHLGPMPADADGVRHVMAWLRCERPASG
jgi:hypothetical protein